MRRSVTHDRERMTWTTHVTVEAAWGDRMQRGMRRGWRRQEWDGGWWMSEGSERMRGGCVR